jgi:hypothetical protein
MDSLDDPLKPREAYCCTFKAKYQLVNGTALATTADAA